jgi:hypothetical protein
MIARFILRKFMSIDPDGDQSSFVAKTSDAILDFDQSDMPYIPVKIVRENGLYYAWFGSNDKFIGQSKKVDEIHKMAHEHVMKQIGIRFEFVHEKDKVIKGKRP